MTTKKMILSALLIMVSTMTFASVGANPNAIIATLVDGTVIYATQKPQLNKVKQEEKK